MVQIKFYDLSLNNLNDLFLAFKTHQDHFRQRFLKGLPALVAPFARQKGATVASVTEKIHARIGESMQQNFVWFVLDDVKHNHNAKCIRKRESFNANGSLTPDVQIRCLAYAMTDGHVDLQGEKGRIELENRWNTLSLLNEFYFQLGPGFTVSPPRLKTHFDLKRRVWHPSCGFRTKSVAWFAQLRQWCYVSRNRKTPPLEVLNAYIASKEMACKFTAELFLWDGLTAYRKDSNRNFNGINRISLCLCNFPEPELERLAVFLNAFHRPVKTQGKVISGWVWAVKRFSTKTGTYLGLNLILRESNVEDFFECIAGYFPVEFNYKLPLSLQWMCRPAFKIPAKNTAMFGSLSQWDINQTCTALFTLETETFNLWLTQNPEPGCISKFDIETAVKTVFEANVQSSDKLEGRNVQVSMLNRNDAEGQKSVAILKQFLKLYVTHQPDGYTALGQRVPSFESAKQRHLLYPAYVFWFQRQSYASTLLLGPRQFTATVLELCTYALKTKKRGVFALLNLVLNPSVWHV